MQNEYNLLKDAFLGYGELLTRKLNYLASIAQPEKWDFQSSNDKPILLNYLCFTYDKLLEEGNIAYSADKQFMCFNTGLLTRHDADIYALFAVNNNPKRKEGQNWFLSGFKTASDSELRSFSRLPDIADYFTDPSDFILDKKLPIAINFDHIIDDNIDRFQEIGLNDKYIIRALLQSAVLQISERVKRNYKLAIPQYYTDKTTGVSRIQLLLPLFLKQQDVADLALAVDKSENTYVGKTILTIEWAYMNSRRIVRPEVDWLKI